MGRYGTVGRWAHAAVEGRRGDPESGEQSRAEQSTADDSSKLRRTETRPHPEGGCVSGDNAPHMCRQGSATPVIGWHASLARPLNPPCPIIAHPVLIPAAAAPLAPARGR